MIHFLLADTEKVIYFATHRKSIISENTILSKCNHFQNRPSEGAVAVIVLVFTQSVMGLSLTYSLRPCLSQYMVADLWQRKDNI